MGEGRGSKVLNLGGVFNSHVYIVFWVILRIIFFSFFGKKRVIFFKVLNRWGEWVMGEVRSLGLSPNFLVESSLSRIMH